MRHAENSEKNSEKPKGKKTARVICQPQYWELILSIFGLLLCAMPASGADCSNNTVLASPAIVCVQSLSESTASSTTTNILAFGSNNAVGHLLIAVIRVSTNTLNLVTSITDTNSNVWARAGASQATTGTDLEIWYAMNSVAGANTVTVHFGSSLTSRLALFEYSGILTSGALDQSTGAVNAASNAVDSGAVTTTAANELIFSAEGTSAVQTPTVGSGYTLRSAIITSTVAGYTEDQGVSTTQTLHGTFTVTGTPAWACIIVTFKAAGSAATVVQRRR